MRRRFELGLNFSYSSAPPFSAYLSQNDFNGDGTNDDLLPGTTVNAFKRGMGRADLEKFVSHFNSKYALTKDAQGRALPRLVLPAEYAFGDNFHSLDLRLSRSFVFEDRWRLSLIGEVFNVYNKANLTGYSGDLTSAAFGQPTSRATQVFGSGGTPCVSTGHESRLLGRSYWAEAGVSDISPERGSGPRVKFGLKLKVPEAAPVVWTFA
jgi:hypothetical protein